ncbi:MAG TPA: phage tail assembly chaperone [Noviherbaspirillum sp.]|nr:phage tail assembly chaperone [Noviherbaspirillum sp.]
MAKAKLVLTPNPTFKAKVAIPVPGAGTTDVEFTFKHRSKDQLKEFMESNDGRGDVEVIMDMCSGWELAEPFDEEHVEQLAQQYVGSSQAIFETYLRESTGAGYRQKN